MSVGSIPDEIKKNLKLKYQIKTFSHLSTAQFFYQMVEELYADATIFAIFTYSGVLLHFLYFENSSFCIVKVTFFIKVV